MTRIDDDSAAADDDDVMPSTMTIILTGTSAKGFDYFLEENGNGTSCR